MTFHKFCRRYFLMLGIKRKKTHLDSNSTKCCSRVSMNMSASVRVGARRRSGATPLPRTRRCQKVWHDDFVVRLLLWFTCTDKGNPRVKKVLVANLGIWVIKRRGHMALVIFFNCNSNSMNNSYLLRFNHWPSDRFKILHNVQSFATIT